MIDPHPFPRLLRSVQPWRLRSSHRVRRVQSRRIPTGWDVTLDLVRKLAAVEKEAPEPNPETWFRNKFGSEPDYSKLLDQLGKTQPDRQQILRGYWEPSDEERAAGEKEPTSAHHAIAALASRGFIKVIITTNFDRLTERRAV